jgi:hypothetical protein
MTSLRRASTTSPHAIEETNGPWMHETMLTNISIHEHRRNRYQSGYSLTASRSSPRIQIPSRTSSRRSIEKDQAAMHDKLERDRKEADDTFDKKFDGSKDA